MDIVTHGLVGATLSSLKPTRGKHKQAALVGFLAGIAADADALIYSSSDPLLTLEFHRHFSHALFFIPVGALLVSALLWPVFKKHFAWRDLFLHCCLGYSFSGTLDAMTSYGTYLFWPLIDQRIQFSVISIVDPILSLILIVGLSYGLKQTRRTPMKISLGLACMYLFLCFAQQQRATLFYEAVIAERAHVSRDLIVKPTFANILLWRGVYSYDNHYYVDGIRAGLDTRLYAGTSILSYHASATLPPSTRQFIDRFSALSNGYVVSHPSQPNVVGDIRYAMEPTSINPIWGVRVKQGAPEFLTFRKPSATDRQRFIAMLLGQDL